MATEILNVDDYREGGSVGLILLFVACAGAVALMTTKFWIFVGAILLALIRAVILLRRRRKQGMANLRRLNRGNIDLQPNWVKKPWQHDEGECMRARALHETKIDAFASKPLPKQNGAQPHQLRD